MAHLYDVARREIPVPALIDDPAALEEIGADLHSIGYPHTP